MTALFLAALLAGAIGQSPTACATAEQCRTAARAAIDSSQFELAHDLAWAAYQRGSRNDPETLIMIARTQSLSGRADDAYVMLRRLAEAGVQVPDVSTSPEFARVRNDARWPELLQRLEMKASTTVPDAAPEGARSEVSAAPPKASEPPGVTSPPPAAPAPAPVPPKRDLSEGKSASAGADLGVPALPFTPDALVYDAVSARFVLSGAATDALMVLSQTSRNAAAFTSRGWSGHDRTTALAIDRAAGDLWVAVHGASGAALHRLQLISGRRLGVLEPPDSTPVEIVALSASPHGFFALDRLSRRVLRRSAPNSLETFVTLDGAIAPRGLAQSATSLYIAHDGGLLRVERASRRVQAITAENPESLTGLRSIDWHDGVLLAVQDHGGGRRVVRLRLNRAGTAITHAEVLGPASADAATLVAGVYYYLTDDESGGRVVRGIKAGIRD